MSEIVIKQDNKVESLVDHAITLVCPHCGVRAHMSVVSCPRYELVSRFQPPKAGVAYRCDSCHEPVFLKYKVRPDFGNGRFLLAAPVEHVEKPRQLYDFTHLPPEVSADFREALDCFSIGAVNGFAAMCRRTVQSACAVLGAHGNDKVLNQLRDLKEMAEINDETFAALKRIVIDGHDGAHPHLPRLTPERADILLELVKDVLYQLFIRPGKIKEAIDLRTAASGE